jgi:uncharacterized protein (DUF305 family)
MTTYARFAVLVGAFFTGVVTLTLAACGGQQTGTGGPTTGSGSSQFFNDADVIFAQRMIVHHQQAIMMAKIAESHARDPNVEHLAAQIEAEQAPEIQTMTGWLQAWGKPAPTTTAGMMSSPGMMPSMPTMMPQPDLSKMIDMHGAAFDRMFLEMMITHHEDAVDMTKTEQASGANPEAKQLAKNIETSQTAQITQMQQMLSTPAPTGS